MFTVSMKTYHGFEFLVIAANAKLSVRRSQSFRALFFSWICDLQSR